MSTKSPELIVVSDHVLTMGKKKWNGRGYVAIKDGRIKRAGPLSELTEADTAAAKTMDYGDRPIMPGFIDSHCHMEVAARASYKHVDVRAPACGTVAAVLAKLRAAIPDQLFDGWIVAQGNLFFDQKLAEKRFPTRAELDSVSRDIPIALRAGGHLSILNSKALAIAGIDRNYKPPEYSVMGKCIVDRDGNGDPTGITKEMDDVLPFPRASGSALKEAIRECVLGLFTRYGVTTICEISETIEGLEATSALLLEKKIGIRLAPYLWVPGTMNLEEACSWQHHVNLTVGPDWMDVRGVKIFADGGYSSTNAAMKKPYLHCPNCLGEMGMSREEIRRFYDRTQAVGMGLAIHTNGERAQEIVCETILSGNGRLSGPPVRLEHAGNLLPDYETTVGLWKKAGIVPVPQPTFLFAFGDYFPAYLGEYGARGRFPFRRLLDDGWQLPGSSDIYAGGENNITNPIFGVWCAVERKGYLGKVIDAGQSITVAEALRMHTLNSAIALGQEKDKGSLEPGKMADFIVLDRDPRDLRDNELLQTKVDFVFVDGREVHGRKEAVKPS